MLGLPGVRTFELYIYLFLVTLLTLLPISSFSQGAFYVTSQTNASVIRFDATTGAFIDVFASGSGLTTGYPFFPEANSFGPDGNFYVCNSDSDNIIRFDGTTGAQIDVYASLSGLTPIGLRFSPDGRLFVSSFNFDKVLRFDTAASGFVTFAEGGGLADGGGLTFGPDGNLYVVRRDPVPGSVVRINGQTGGVIDVFTSGLVVTQRALNGIGAPTSIKAGRQVMGSVSLSRAASSNGAVVILSSSDLAASVPGGVKIAPGSKSTKFPIVTSSVAQNTTVFITASYGGKTKVRSVLVTP